jgi:F0F1-type ATP synthase membrane subunit c/vacuolar-type H+-ATPase subunit K
METTVPSILAGLGIAFAVGLSASGSATASTAAAPYLVSGGNNNNNNNEQMFYAMCPIVISGVLAIYGLIVGIIASQAMNEAKDSLSIVEGGRIFAAGLTVGWSCVASGDGLASFLSNYWYNSGGCSDEGNTIRCTKVVDPKEEALLVDPKEKAPLIDRSSNNNYQRHSTKRRLVGDAPIMNLRFIMSLVFLEAIGLYGLIVALIILSS